MRPPLCGIAAVQAQVVEGWTFGRRSCRIDVLNLGSSICVQAAPNVFEQVERRTRVIAPTPMAQFDGDAVVPELLQEPFRGIRALSGPLVKLAGNWARSAPSLPADASGSIARRNSSTSRSPRSCGLRLPGLLEHLGVRELLKELQREVEVPGRAVRPALRCRGRGTP